MRGGRQRLRRRMVRLKNLLVGSMLDVWTLKGEAVERTNRVTDC